MEKKKNFLATGVGICLAAALCNLLWGSAYPCVKIGYGMFSIPADRPFSQILFAGIRFTLAGVLTLVLGSLISRKALLPQKGSWPMILKLSVFQTVIQYYFFYVGLANTTGVKASIIGASSVFVSLLISCLFFRMETFTSLKILGCVLGFSGVVLVNLNGAGADFSMRWNGEGFLLLSSVSYSISTVLMKRYSQHESPVILSGCQFVAGGLMMILGGLAGGGEVHPSSPSAFAMLIYLAMVSAVAYSLWGILLRLNSVSRVAVYNFMNPVFGVLLSALFLQEGTEALGWKALAALFLVCAGIWLVNRKQSRPAGETS